MVFNTPGANANAVAELVIGMLIAGSRNVADAAQWCQGLAGDPAMAKTVEKGKKKFVGNEIKGKTLGVIGLADDIGVFMDNDSAVRWIFDGTSWTTEKKIGRASCRERV